MIFKKLPSILVLLCFVQKGLAQDIPVLKHYDEKHLLNIALPLGGIGTGTVALGGRGELRDWEIMNKPGKKFSTITNGNQAPFFAIYTKKSKQKPQTKALLGPLHPSEYQHYEGRPVNHHGLPRFSHASFDAAYPFGQVNLTDDVLPVNVKIKGWNPFIPGNDAASSIPMAILSYEVENTSNTPLEIAICGTMRNFIGIDGSRQYKNWKGDTEYSGANKNQNTYRESSGIKGIFMSSEGVDKNDQAWGTMAISTPEKGLVSHRRSSIPNNWENAILDFWDDFSEDGLLTDKKELVDNNPMASLAVKKTIQPHQKQTFTFYLTWHFPNRLDWNDGWTYGARGKIIGNFYTTQYADAWEVIQKEQPKLQDYFNQTKTFVESIVKSDYPMVLKEAALFNLSTLRSQTVFRVPSGHLLGWEGVMDETGSCYGSCTHVWNYESATGYLFGSLAKTMREVEMNYGLKPNGKLMNRVSLPLEINENIDHVAAADGQMGCIMRFYREWKLSGDQEWLSKHWSKVKSAMSYAWIKGGWDANADGVEEGRQHNTMDVDYFGPNPQMQFWYFGALRATEEMALAMKDFEMANKCSNIFKKGSQWVDNHLFNGSYYEHKITNPSNYQFIDPNNPATQIPDFQLGNGCLVDQLVGQTMSKLWGLGDLTSQTNRKTTLQSIMKNNFIERFDGIFNNMRSYVMDKESGLIMASWPKGRLKVPFPYFAESMSGFEYTAAIGMLQEGMYDDALKCIKSIRNRYDGEKRNPFDEPECGHNYARAMAAWSTLIAYTGFDYSAITNRFTVKLQKGKFSWSNGYSWGTYTLTGNSLKIEVLHGSLTLNSVVVANHLEKKFNQVILTEGKSNTFFF